MHLNHNFFTFIAMVLIGWVTIVNGVAIAEINYADSKLLQVNDEVTIEQSSDNTGFDQTLEQNFSPEDRARLRKALTDFAKNNDPEHNQIEQKRKEMQENVQARFNDCNKDNDISLDREETTLCLPQVARHFNYVDIDENNVITIEELELAQAKSHERKRAVEAKIEAQKIQEAETILKSKINKVNKEAATSRKRPS